MLLQKRFRELIILNMLIVRLFCLLLLLAPSIGSSQNIGIPEGLPLSLVALTDTLRERCASASQAHFPNASFERPYDFNRDGVADYIVSSDQFRCYPTRNLMFGGTAGTHYWVFISQQNGQFTEAFHTAGHFMKPVFFNEHQTAPALVFFHHGTTCGLSGSSSCVGAVIWDGASNRFVGTGP